MIASPARQRKGSVRAKAAMLGLSYAIVGGTHAGEPAKSGAPPTRSEACDTPKHKQFDFWLGDWQVFDGATNQLIAFDRVEKQFRGCVVQQDLVWLTDQFRRPDLDYRISGRSVSVMTGEGWVMLWMDTYGSSGLVEGGLQADGNMVFQTRDSGPDRPRIKGVWQRGTDGTVRNTGYRSSDGGRTWNKYFDYVYKPNR